jgi:hypothetical protein
MISPLAGEYVAMSISLENNSCSRFGWSLWKVIGFGLYQDWCQIVLEPSSHSLEILLMQAFS